jgi:hypothetical protein
LNITQTATTIISKKKIIAAIGVVISMEGRFNKANPPAPMKIKTANKRIMTPKT